MSDKALIDANILFYLIDTNENEKHKKSLRWFESLESDEFVLSSQTLREFANIAIKKSTLKKEEIISYLDLFIDKFALIQDNYFDAIKAVQLVRNKRNFFDSLLAATMLRNYITTIVTENTKDFEELGVKTINPLK